MRLFDKLKKKITSYFMRFVDKHKNDDIKFHEICQHTIKIIRAYFMKFVSKHNKNYHISHEIC